MKDAVKDYLELRLQEAKLVNDEVTNEFIVPYLEELVSYSELENSGQTPLPNE